MTKDSPGRRGRRVPRARIVLPTMKPGSAQRVQQGGEHGAGGGFAVGAGHAEAAVASQQRSQELLAFDHGDACGLCGRDLRVGRRYRRGDQHQVGAGHVGGIVSHEHCCA